MTKGEEVDFNVFVGAETGILKGVNVNKKGNIIKNFHNLKGLEKQFEITCCTFGDGEGEILMGLRNQTVKVYDVQFRSFSQCIDTPGGSGPLVGVARHDDTIVTACESGVVSYWKFENKSTIDPIGFEVNRMGKLKSKDLSEFKDEEEREKHRVKLREGRTLAKMRQSPFVKNQIGLGGKETDLQIWDLMKPEEPIFRAKNVKPDFLELRQEIWISDLAWLTPDTVAVCSRYGQIRKYDVRIGGKQRRPVGELVWEEVSKGQGRVSNTALAALGENQVIVGTSQGKLGLWDWRTGAGHQGVVRKFGGCVGAVTEISTHNNNKYFCAVGLDRYLRVWHHGAGGKLPLYKLYLKSRLNSVLMTREFDPEAVRKEQVTESKPMESANEEDDDDCIEILDSSTEDVKLTVAKEESEEEDDIWDNMVVIDNKKRKPKDGSSAKRKKLK